MYAVIDTSVLVYDTVEDSEKHSDAEELLESLDGWLIPSLVLYEYVWFFKRQGIESSEVKGLVEGYLSDPLCRILSDNGTHLKKAFEKIASRRLSLARFNDMVVLSHAMSERTPLATFDGKLRKIAEGFRVRVLP